MTKSKIPKSIEEWVWFYYNQGFGVIPLKQNSKAPNIPSYKEYEFSRANEQTIKQWLKDDLFGGIGVQCGLPSNGLCVIDIDREKVINDLKLNFDSIINSGCWVSATGKGYHLWTFNLEAPGSTVLDGDVHVDFKTTGYIVVPPSIHPIDKHVLKLTPYKFINKTFPPLKPMTSRKMYETMRKKLRELYDIKDLCEDEIEDRENVNAPCVSKLLDGVAEGTRDEAAFVLTQYYYKIKKVDEEATYSIMREWNNKNRPPLNTEEINKCIKQGITTNGKTGCTKIRSMKKCPFDDIKDCPFLYPDGPKKIPKTLDLSNPPSSLEDVYNKLRKWLFIDDTYRIDLTLAAMLSNKARESKPIWVFIIGRSGDGKSELTMGFKDYPDVLVLDRITSNTLATGKTFKNKKLHDLGEDLQNSSHIILFSDLACLKSVNKDEKNEIWGQLRELYDGRINKKTGNDTSCMYDNCHVTLIACSTPDIKDEYSIHNQLGTRELCYEIEGNIESNDEKMLRAISHLGFETDMKKDIAIAVQSYVASKKFEMHTPSKKLTQWMFDKCKELSTMRATARFESRTGELSGNVTWEVPTRLIQQFMLLYSSFMSLDKDYPEDRFKHIINNLVSSSGELIRQRLFKFFRDNQGQYCLDDLSEIHSYGRTTIKRQCEVLTALKVLKRTFHTELYGANDNFERRIRRYEWNGKKETKQKELI